MDVNKTMFIIMKVLVLSILPVLSSAQFGHKHDRVYIHVNKPVSYETQPTQDLYIESDSSKSQGFADERGKQFETYPVNSRSSFNDQRITNSNNNPSEIQSRTNENSRSRTKLDDGLRNEDRTEEDISIEDYRGSTGTNRKTNHGNDRVDFNAEGNQRGSNTGNNQGSSETGRSQSNFNTGTNQGSSRNQPSRRTITDSTDQHNIVFVDSDENAYTNKPNANRNESTQDNEIPRPVTDEDSARNATTAMPSVDDRAAFVGDKCPDGRVRFNGVCVEVDDR